MTTSGTRCSTPRNCARRRSGCRCCTQYSSWSYGHDGYFAPQRLSHGYAFSSADVTFSSDGSSHGSVGSGGAVSSTRWHDLRTTRSSCSRRTGYSTGYNSRGSAAARRSAGTYGSQTGSTCRATSKSTRIWSDSCFRDPTNKSRCCHVHSGGTTLTNGRTLRGYHFHRSSRRCRTRSR